MGSRVTDTHSLRATGEVAGATSATAMPDIGGRWVKIKALSDNTGNVYIGLSSSVTKANDATDTTTGWPLDAGEETDWLPVPNGSLENLYYICDGTTDCFVYMVLT